MSSVLHPVGPEPPQTYWVRRVLVLVSAILVVAVVAALIMSQSNSAAVSASPPPVASPDTASATPAASATPQTSATTAKVAPAAKPKPKPAQASVRPPAKPTRVPVHACPSDELRATLTGRTRLKTARANTFEISLINGSGHTCRVAVTGANFELKIYSGSDRIWSSDDCSKAVPRLTKNVKAERAVAWTMKWDGRRSRDNCKRRPEIPRAGTYFATAQFKGAKPVQLRMILR